MGKSANNDESDASQNAENDAASNQSLSAKLSHGDFGESTWSTLSFWTLVVFLVLFPIGSTLLLVDHDAMCLSNRLDLSAVSDLVEGVVTAVSLWVSSRQSGFELVDVLLRDWIDGSKLIPVNVGSAWRSGDRSSINPSVVGVNHIQKISISCETNLPFLIWLFRIKFVHSETIEELIDDFLLGPSKFSSIIVDGEHDTHCRSHKRC